MCELGGELICCSTCNLVFHLECIRPYVSDPPDNWSCAHCDATGVTGLKKDSKQRKTAIEGVREMEKLQREAKVENVVNRDNEKVRGEAAHPIKDQAPVDGLCHICGFSNDLIQCSQPSCGKMFHRCCIRQPINEEDVGVDWVCAYCDAANDDLKPQSRRKRAAGPAIRSMDKLKTDYDQKRALGTIENPTSMVQSESPLKRKEIDMSTPEHPGHPRSQRPKLTIDGNETDHEGKQEQSCESLPSADTVSVFPTLIREDIPAELIKKLAPKVTNSNSRHGQYTCKFCMDDEKSPTCCFCACRICFSKSEKENTILCDICDGEYHLGCLVPPLPGVPTDDWFCPTCMAAIEKTLGEKKRSKNESESSKVKASNKAIRKPGRPKGSGMMNILSKKTMKEFRVSHSLSQPRTVSGRFAPKSEHSTLRFEVVAPGGTVLRKRGPGRPPKAETMAKRQAESEAAKLAIESGLVSSTPGRFNNQYIATSGSVAPQSQQRSRSGRVVKRNTLFDDIEEGPQLLHTPTNKYAGVMEEDRKTPSGRNTELSISSEETTKVDAKNIPIAPSGGIVSNPSMEKSLTPTSEIIASKSLALNSTSTEKIDTVSSVPIQNIPISVPIVTNKAPRRKPGARECMQISRRFGADIIPANYMEILIDYATRGKVEHLIRMRERMDDHSRFLESQLAGLEALIQDRAIAEGKIDISAKPSPFPDIPLQSNE